MSDTTIDVEHLVTSSALIQRVGITYRQLDYWTTTGILSPIDGTGTGTGNPRLFPLSQVTLARTIHELLTAGLTLTAAVTVAHQLNNDGRAHLKSFTITRGAA